MSRHRLLEPLVLAAAVGALAAPLAAAECATGGEVPDLPTSIPSASEGYVVKVDLDPASVDYLPLGLAFDAVVALDSAATPAPGHPAGYHHGYVGLHGFREPSFTGTWKTEFFNCCENGVDCDNGKAPKSSIWMPVELYAQGENGPASSSCIRMILGHELFHHVQFAYGDAASEGTPGCYGYWGKTVCEGTARALQDKIYLDLDIDPDASCVAPYLGSVKGYLKAPEQYLWSASYSSALFWTYLMEQYGDWPLEPGRGTDFLVAWYENAEAAWPATSVFDITEQTIEQADPGQGLVSSFRSFVLANVIKDLDVSQWSAAFRDRYTYRDEDAVLLFNQDDYHQVPLPAPLPVPTGGAVVTAATLPPWGTTYLQADVSSCPTGALMSATFLPQPTSLFGNPVLPPVAAGVLVVQDGATERLDAFYKKLSTGWTLNRLQGLDRAERLIVSLSGFVPSTSGAPPFALVVFGCDTSVHVPTLPVNPPAHVTLPGAPGDGLLEIEVAVLPEARGASGVQGLDPRQIEVLLGGRGATVLGAIADGDRYRLSLAVPDGLDAGPHDLLVRVAGSEVTIEDAAVVAVPAPDRLLVFDLSASVGDAGSPKLPAVQRAASLFSDLAAPVGRIGLVGFAGNDAEPDDDAFVAAPLLAIDDEHRGRMRLAIAALAAGPERFTSLGDGLARALAQLDPPGLAAGPRHAVLVTDGSENEELFWHQVEADVLAAGMRVHTVALGDRADQRLLQRIAEATGGLYQHVPDPPGVPADEVGDELAAAFAQLAARIEGWQTLLAAERTPVPGAVTVLPLPVDESGLGAGALAVDWATGDVALELRRPDGTLVVDGAEGAAIRSGEHHTVFALPEVPSGIWQLSATTPPVPDAPPTLHLLLQAAVPLAGLHLDLGVTSGEVDGEQHPDLRSGDPVALHAALWSGGGPVLGATALARVAHPAGSETLVLLHDDGGPGDLLADDGVYAGRYERTSAASRGGFPDDDTAPGVPGSYAVRVEVTAPGEGAATRRSARRSFHVVDPGSVPDSDLDGLPDRYEGRHACLDPEAAAGAADSDGDGLSDREEWLGGTDPCAADTDEGGENDGSEAAHGRDPLDRRDDAVAPALDARIDHAVSEHEEIEPPFEPRALRLRYGGGRGWTEVEIRRALQPEGPFTTVARFPLADHPGLWIDRGLVAGRAYHYQVVGHGADGATTAPSPVASAVAAEDAEPPAGSIVVHGGLPRTDDPLLDLRLAVYNEDPPQVEMRLRTGGPDDDDDWGSWLPFQESATVPVAAVAAPVAVSASLQLRDAAGNLSETYLDGLELWPAASLGGIAGRLLGGGGPEVAALVEIVGGEVEPRALTDATGDFLIDELVPGHYTLRLHWHGHALEEIGAVTVSAGAVTDLGTVVNVFDLFADGFESGDTSAWTATVPP